MKKKLFFLISLFSLGLIYYFTHSNTFPSALSRGSFNTSLGVDKLGKEFVFEKPLDKEIGEIAHQLIEKRRQEWHKNAKSPIPLILHQIWTGEGPMEDTLARGVQSIKIFHKNIPTTIWTPKDYEPLLENTLGSSWKELPKGILDHVVGAIILLQHGGVVIDPATECVQSVTPLLSLGDCIIGFEPPSSSSHFKRRLMLSPAVIASAPSHPLIEAWLREMLQRAVSHGAMKPKKFYRWTVKESLTSVVSSQALKSGRVLLVGPTYFCPIERRHIKEFQEMVDGSLHRSTLKKILQTLHILPCPPYSDITHETIFIHIPENRPLEPSQQKLRPPLTIHKKKKLETKKKPDNLSG